MNEENKAKKWNDIDKSEIESMGNILWDELRLECCATKLNAHRIVMLNKEDVFKVLEKLVNKA